MRAKKRYIPQIIIPEIKTNWNDYQVKEAFLSMKGDKKKWAEIAFSLKYTGNNKLINLTQEGLFKSNFILNSVIWGNTMPKKIEDLGTGWNHYLYKPKSVDIEINWVLQCLKKHKGILRQFVPLRDKVEKSILLGDYSQAELLLEESLNSIGYTVWYYEMRLTIAGLQDDLSKCIGIVSNFNTIHKDLKRGFVPIVFDKSSIVIFKPLVKKAISLNLVSNTSYSYSSVSKIVSSAKNLTVVPVLSESPILSSGFTVFPLSNFI